MGTSTNANVIYGIALEGLGDVDIHADTEDLPEDHPARMYACAEPFDGICIDAHCSDSCPMYIIGLDDTRVCALRGSPELLDEGYREVTPEEPQKLLDYCAKWGFVIDEKVGLGKPRWLVYSWWS